MAELHVMDALREKRSELGGVVSRLEQRLARHRGSLAHLDATMRLFDPDLLFQGLTQHSRCEVQSSAGCLAGSSLHAHVARDRDSQICLGWL